MSLGLNYTDLRRAIGRLLGFDRATTSWTANQTTDVEDYLGQGVRQFLWPISPEGALIHSWSFLRKSATITLVDGDYDYDLPDDFASMVGDPILVSTEGGRIDRIDPEVILAMQSKHPKADQPTNYAIQAKTFDAAVGTKLELILYPTPDVADTLTYVYMWTPDELSWDDYPLGGVVHSETVLEACLAAAELGTTQLEGVHAKRFAERLAASINVDQEQRA